MLGCYKLDIKFRNEYLLNNIFVREIADLRMRFERIRDNLDERESLASGSSGLGSSPGKGHCVVFLGKRLYSHSASTHPGT